MGVLYMMHLVPKKMRRFRGIDIIRQGFLFLLALLIVIIFSNSVAAQSDIDSLIAAGKFTQAERAIRSQLEIVRSMTPARKLELHELLNNIQSVSGQFNVSYHEMYGELKKLIPDLQAEDISRWEKDYTLEFIQIDGQKRYFYAWKSNLLRLNDEARKRAGKEEPHPRSDSLIREVIEAARESSTPLVCPRSIRISLSYFEDVSTVPDGEVLRAWLPIARQNRFQDNIEILKLTADKYLSPQPSQKAAAVYFEFIVNKANMDNADWAAYFSNPDDSWIKPLRNASLPITDSNSLFTKDHHIHQIIFCYRAFGLYQEIDLDSVQFQIDPKIEPYIQQSHNPYLVNLAQEIVGQEANPYLQAQKIYEWICRNITWTEPFFNPLRYDCPAEQAARLLRGDCGAKSDLFIELCRIKGIPARSQGGWSVKPDRQHSQHTWAQMYFAPYGWLPVDPTAGSHFIDHPDSNVRFFHFGNCLPYRLVIYDDESQLFPLQINPQTLDGGRQLGSFEWRGGVIETNLKIDSDVSMLP